MFSSILTILYITSFFIILLAISIALPRIAKTNPNGPAYIYTGFYVVNTLIFNYLLHIYPLKTVLFNFTILLISHLLANKIRLIGLTGQICSGKTTVSKYLTEKYNACVIDIDKLNKEVLEYKETKDEIRKHFSDKVFLANGELDKMELRKIIFNDINKRRVLERITHFKVFLLFFKIVIKEKLLYRTKYIFVENAILLRFKLFLYLCYPIISICTNQRADIVRRIMDRDKSDKDTAIKVLENQTSIKEFVDKSDYVVFNDTDIEYLKGEIDKFMIKLN